jgi:hypothetical protein
MRGEDQSVDIAALDHAWNSSWPGCPPVAHQLRRRFPGRWVRFHTLPGSKRYATSEAEHAEILRRHHRLLTALLKDAGSGDQTLVAITCSWSATAQPTPRHPAVAATMPQAAHWRSDDLAYEPGFHSWQHHFASRTGLGEPALDQLLLCVADDMTDGVIVTTTTCAWAFHPYDGGMDVFTASATARDRLAAVHAEWLPPVASGS